MIGVVYVRVYERSWRKSVEIILCVQFYGDQYSVHVVELKTTPERSVEGHSLSVLTFSSLEITLRSSSDLEILDVWVERKFKIGDDKSRSYFRAVRTDDLVWHQPPNGASYTVFLNKLDQYTFQT